MHWSLFAMHKNKNRIPKQKIKVMRGGFQKHYMSLLNYGMDAIAN